MFETDEPGMLVKLGAPLVESLRLEPGAELDDVPSHIDTASAKVSKILSCAQVLAAQHFPLLSKATWAALLSSCEEFLLGDLPAAQILSHGFLTQQEFIELDDCGLSDEEMDELASLSSAELFAVHLTMDRFLSQSIYQEEEDPRSVLAFISGRQPEFVFKDDIGSPLLRPLT